ncbi:MAG: hypothetical protein AB1758_27220 [Candidatus Eremiobacterota bacterium]
MVLRPVAHLFERLRPNPKPAVARPMDPSDVATLGQTANPWPELAEAGVLSLPVSHPGPLGLVLTEATREGLLGALIRLDRAGVEVSRMVRGKRFWRKTRKRLEPAEVLEQIERTSGDRLKQLELSFRGRSQPEGMQHLRDLQVLDAELGLGETALTPDVKPYYECLIDLREAGWSNAPTPTLLDTLNLLHRGGGASLVRAPEGQYVPWGKIGDLRVDGKGIDRLAALNFLHGSGSDLGLADPLRAAGLRELEQRGIRLYHQNEEVMAHIAYHSPHLVTSVGVAGTFQVPVKESDVLTAAALYDAGLEVYRSCIRPALEAVGESVDPPVFPSSVLEAFPVHSVEAAGDTFARLASRSPRLGKDDEPDEEWDHPPWELEPMDPWRRTSRTPLQEVDELCAVVLRESHSETQRQELTRLAGEVFAAQGFGAALETLEQQADVIRLTVGAEDAAAGMRGDKLVMGGVVLRRRSG